MRVVSFETAGRPSWGVVDGQVIADVGGVLGATAPDLKTALRLAVLDQAAEAAHRAPRLRRADVRMLPLIPNPTKILCIGLNYETHRQETGRDKTAHPAIFTRFADSQIGDGDDLICPRVSTHLDYEGELAIVIGKGGRYISSDEAMSHVAGYSCYNDATIRDWQRHTLQFTPGKNFPGTGAFGPWMVTSDEVKDYRTLHLETRVNGEVVQSASLADLVFGIPELISYCSSFTPLEPGDVIATGTPGGVGFKRNPPRFLKAGDVVEVEISGVGLLRNGVVNEG